MILNTRFASSNSGWEKTISSLLVWSAQNSDLNPIEQLSEELERRIRTRKYKKQIKLMQGIKKEWNEIPFDGILTLIDPMPRRRANVIRSLCFLTCYLKRNCDITFCRFKNRLSLKFLFQDQNYIWNPIFCDLGIFPMKYGTFYSITPTLQLITEKSYR